MLKRFVVAAALMLAASGGALAQSAQYGAGTVAGNSSASARPARPETVTAILDRAFGSSRGMILMRGASGWQTLSPGTAGLALISGGAGADLGYAVLGLSGGGSNNAALTASNGGVVWSDATKLNVLAGTATARKMLQSGASASPAWSTTTWPATSTINRILYSSSANVIDEIATANNGVLVTSAGGVPSISTTLPSGLTGAALTKTDDTNVTLTLGGSPTTSLLNAASLTLGWTGTLGYSRGGCNAATQTACRDNIFPTPTRAGDIAYWNGSIWTTLAGNNSGTKVLQQDSSGVPSWATVSGTGTVTSAQFSAGAGITVTTTAGANPCTATCNLTISANNSMGANKLQVFTSGSGTVTTPTGAAWVKFTLYGAGGGGSGGGTSAGTGSTGGNTCINTSGAACTSPVYQAGGGAGGNFSTGAGGAGGAVSGSGSCLYSFAGEAGKSTPTNSIASTTVSGAAGGGSTIGGAGAGTYGNATGAAAVANTGGGGQGGGATSGAAAGAGGGAGATCVAFIQSPAASYTYAIGASGGGGTAGTSSSAGGAGAAGFLIAEYGFN